MKRMHTELAFSRDLPCCVLIFVYEKRVIFTLMHKENRKTTILDRIDFCIYMHPGVYIPLKPCISI